MNTTETNFLTMTLSREDHEIARKFSVQQDTVEKGEQVYLNTLAILGVRSFLDWLGIETDLNAGDSWHPVVRCFRDVADLVIPNLGKLECRPVLPGETVISLPPEVSEDRIAYIVVQFQEQLNELQLLGFYPAIDPLAPPKEIEIANLQPIESLIDYLDRLESARDLLESNEEVARKVRARLAERSISEIAAQLERIYRTYDKYERRYAGGDLLAGYVNYENTTNAASTINGEEFSESQQVELQDLAEELLEKLDEIWGDDVEEEKVGIDSSNYVAKPLQSNQSAFTTPNARAIEGFIPLSEWLQNSQSLLKYNFQTLESYLSGKQGNEVLRFATAPRSRSAETGDASIGITGVKEVQLAEDLLALIIGYRLESADKRDIILRLYPTGSNTYLPAGVQLIVLEESGNIFLEATARSADNWIQLKFRGEPGERFSIKVAFGDVGVTDNFVM